MSSVLRPVRKRKKGRTLGRVGRSEGARQIQSA